MSNVQDKGIIWNNNNNNSNNNDEDEYNDFLGKLEKLGYTLDINISVSNTTFLWILTIIMFYLKLTDGLFISWYVVFLPIAIPLFVGILGFALSSNNK